jgi:hypothetical protein
MGSSSGVASEEVDLTVVLLLPLVVFRAGALDAGLLLPHLSYTMPKREVEAHRGGTRSCAAPSGSSATDVIEQGGTHPFLGCARAHSP